MPLAGNHFRRPAGTFGDLRMVQRRRDRVAIDLAGLLDGRFPKFETTVSPGRRTSRGNRNVPGNCFS